MTKCWKDPKVVAKGEMPPGLFRGAWGQAILQVTLTLGQLDPPSPEEVLGGDEAAQFDIRMSVGGYDDCSHRSCR